MTTTAPPTNGAPETAIAKRSYNPLAPIGSAGALKGLLETQRAGIAQILPKHITPERLFKTALVAANRQPDLLQCTQMSLVESINRAAELGLDLSGTLGEAYLVPFNNRVKINNRDEWVKQCQLIIGYRGLAKLARQTGDIQIIDADVVCEHDTFTLRKGSNATCEFIPNLKGERGEVIGAYAYVKFKDGGEQFDFMPFGDIEKVRRRSKSGSNKDGDAIGAWKSDWSEMAKKTVFRRVAKWLPLSTEKYVRAIEADDADHGLTEVLEAETLGGARRGGAAALVDKLHARGNEPATDPFGNPLVTGQAPASEEEAERILQEAAARARQNDQQADNTGGAGHVAEEEPAAGAEPAADEQQQQQTAAGDDETTPTTLPNPCPVSWVVTQLMKQRPEGMSEKEAEQQIGTHLRIRLPRPWDKMTASGKQHHWDEWQEKGFPWKPAAGA